MKGPARRQRAISKQGDAKFRAQLLDCLFDAVYFVNAERKITYGIRDRASYGLPIGRGRRPALL
jgi:hypothetical protein